MPISFKRFDRSMQEFVLRHAVSVAFRAHKRPNGIKKRLRVYLCAWAKYTKKVFETIGRQETGMEPPKEGECNNHKWRNMS
jgi:hypothetical protein